MTRSLMTTTRFATALIAVVAAAGSALGVAGTASAATAPTAPHAAIVTTSQTTATTVKMEAQFLSLLNARRAGAHLAPMKSSADLVALSRTWSAKMAGGVGLAHDPNLAKELTNWAVAGQNVGDGTDVVTLDNAFWASPGHRANELYPTFSQVGIGVVISGGQVWVTFDFRQPAASVAAPAATQTATQTAAQVKAAHVKAAHAAKVAKAHRAAVRAAKAKAHAAKVAKARAAARHRHHA